MKKFERLPPQQRKEEICAAALELFREKGYAATTMENIIDKVSLSKGGVYRLYPSTKAILSDLMIDGMRKRNAYYEERARQETAEGRPLTLRFLVEIICESLSLFPEISSVYVEFLWEKQRDPELEKVYQDIYTKTLDETEELIKKYGADSTAHLNRGVMEHIGVFMNAAILSLRVLNQKKLFSENKDRLCDAVINMLNTKS